MSNTTKTSSLVQDSAFAPFRGWQPWLVLFLLVASRLVYYGNQRQLEHDFVIAPGADPSHIRLRLRGVRNLRVANNGDLLMHAGDGELRLLKSEIYQDVDGARWPVEGRYAVRGKDRISFEVANYDAARPLVIDPVLSYSTYLGGSLGDTGYGIALDASGNAYVTGETSSTDFPTANALQADYAGNRWDWKSENP